MNAFKRLVEELDPVLHERGRLAIVSVLAAVERLTFTELRDALDMTDGNLSVHLQKLEEKGYVAIDKQFVGRRPQTSCRLTRAGRQAFTQLSRPPGSDRAAGPRPDAGVRAVRLIGTGNGRLQGTRPVAAAHEKEADHASPHGRALRHVFRGARRRRPGARI